MSKSLQLKKIFIKKIIKIITIQKGYFFLRLWCEYDIWSC